MPRANGHPATNDDDLPPTYVRTSKANPTIQAKHDPWCQTHSLSPPYGRARFLIKMPLMDFFTNDSLFSDFDRILDSAFSRGTWQIGGPRWHTQFLEDDGPQVFRPRVDVCEDRETKLVSTTFEFSGESGSEAESNGNGCFSCERLFHRVSSLVPVPGGVQPEEIKASMENSVLTVTYTRQILEYISKKIITA